MEGGGDYDEDIFDQINKQLFKIINIRLNKEVLCEGCKGEKIKKEKQRDLLRQFRYYTKGCFEDLNGSSSEETDPSEN